jgi:hypothetical protein
MAFACDIVGICRTTSAPLHNKREMKQAIYHSYPHLSCPLFRSFPHKMLQRHHWVVPDDNAAKLIKKQTGVKQFLLPLFKW